MVIPWTHILILGTVRLGKTGTKEVKVTPFETGFRSASKEPWHAQKKKRYPTGAGTAFWSGTHRVAGHGAGTPEEPCGERAALTTPGAPRIPGCYRQDAAPSRHPLSSLCPLLGHPDQPPSGTDHPVPAPRPAAAHPGLDAAPLPYSPSLARHRPGRYQPVPRSLGPPALPRPRYRRGGRAAAAAGAPSAAPCRQRSGGGGSGTTAGEPTAGTGRGAGDARGTSVSHTGITHTFRACL